MIGLSTGTMMSAPVNAPANAPAGGALSVLRASDLITAQSTIS
ncbi:hypothetical protein ACN2XU_03010 [Primorskyibacter sp. 2E107]